MSSPAGQETWDSARRVVGHGLVSILMPAHDLAGSIAANIRTVRDVLSGQVPFELVVIDDGSKDGTAAAIRALASEIPELRPVLLEQNVGKGAALRRGFEACRGTHIAFLDGDLDLPPGQLARLFQDMAETGADVVIGSKQHPDSILQYPWLRRLMSGLYYRLVKLLVGLPVHDTQTGLKLFTRASLEWAFPRILIKAFAFDLELLALVHLKGFRIAESPVTLNFHGHRLGLVRLGMVYGIVNDTLAVFYRLRLLKYYQSIPDAHIPEPPPLVSILIAYPAHSAYLEEALAHVGDQTYRHFEVILLPDEKSGKSYPDWCREIPTGRIRPAEKRNLGIAQARGSIVAFLDDDAFPTGDWLECALGYFSISNVGAVGGPAVTPLSDPYLAQLGGRVYTNRLVSGSYVYRYLPGRVRDVDDYPSCNLFVRAEVLRKLNGFRADFWPGEDTYLCMELTHTLRRRILYEPRALVQHHRRPLFLPHLRQIGRYGLHRGYFARRFPATSRRLGYMMPSLFVTGLVLGGLAAALVPFLRMPYFLCLALYGAITLLFSASIRPHTWLLTWLGIVLTHLTYGVRFIMGWLTRRLPGEVQRFDHPSEQGGRQP